MKHNRFILTIAIFLIVTLLWVTGSVLADRAQQAPVDQGDPNSADPQAIISTNNLPTRMSYQGILYDESGNPPNGSHELTFTIYRYRISPMLNPWPAIYSETQTVECTNGLFSVEIGAVTPLDPDLFGGASFLGGALELGVQVDGSAELAPRTKILSVPYAYRAHYVNRHPRPTYDSGWDALLMRLSPTTVTFTHNLGGDVDEYVVDLQCRYDGKTYEGRSDRAYIADITDSQVVVWIASGLDPSEIRVRIWNME